MREDPTSLDWCMRCKRQTHWSNHVNSPSRQGCLRCAADWEKRTTWRPQSIQYIYRWFVEDEWTFAGRRDEMPVLDPPPEEQEPERKPEQKPD